MAKQSSSKTREAAWAAQGERVLQRLLEDKELQGRLLGAYGSARSAYGRLGNGRGATHALFEDPELQQELLSAANALRSASMTLMEAQPAPKRKPRRRRGRRSLMLIVLAGILAVALSADLRSKVLDMLFGAEEEFDYTSTTAPATPAPATVAGS